MSFANLLAFFLRAASAAAKLLLVSYLGSGSNAAILGQLAIFMSITAVFTQIAGLEINQVTGRQFHNLNPEQRKILQNNHCFAAITAYLVLIPIILIIYYDLLNTYWLLGVFILILEHFITEIYRVNILALRSIYASTLLFIKNAGWVFLFIVVVQLKIFKPNLEVLVTCWLLVLSIAIAPIILSRRSLLIVTQYINLKSWIKDTTALILDARPFIISAAAVAGAGAIDKLIIAEYFTLNKLGSYFFFQNLAAIPALLVTFSLGATLWPKCIQLSSTGRNDDFSIAWQRMNRLFILSSIVFSIFLAILIPAILHFTKKVDYLSEIDIFFYLIIGSVFFILCDPHKLKLYVEKKDKELTLGNVFQFSLILIFTSAAATLGNINSVAAALAVANAISLTFYWLNIPVRLLQKKNQ